MRHSEADRRRISSREYSFYTVILNECEESHHEKAQTQKILRGQAPQNDGRG